MSDVTVTRATQPPVCGGANQRSVLYQVANLEAGLKLIDDGEALVVKSRPDFVFATPFLRDKIVNYELLSRTDDTQLALGAALPASPLKRKIWLPWADAGQFFFYEDGAFMGLKSDLESLVTPEVDKRFSLISDPGDCGSFSHVVRFAPIFLERFPIFQRYLAEYSAFLNDTDYRLKLVRLLLDDAFFWHLVVAHGWVLFSSFHVDCGRQDDLLFYPNTSNPRADWNDLKSLRLGNPYDSVIGWRQGMQQGVSMFATLGRPYARLLDDNWQTRLFTQSFADFPKATLAQIAGNIANYGSGLLKELEDRFYAKLLHFHIKECLDAPVRIAG